MFKNHSRNYLFKTLFLSLVLASTSYSLAAANDQPIVHDDDQTHIYSQNVDINTTHNYSNYYNTAVIALTAGSTSSTTTINFEKDLNINLNSNQLVDGLNMGVLAMATNINVDGNLMVNIDARDNKSSYVYGLVSVSDAGNNPVTVQGDFTANIYGGTGDNITGIVGSATIKGSSTINLYADKGVKSVYGYGEPWDRRIIIPLTISGGTHTINIQAENGSVVGGIFKVFDTTIQLTDNAQVGINISSSNDGSLAWNDMQIQGVRGTPDISAGSLLNIKMNLDKTSTFNSAALPVQTQDYKYYYTPAGIYITLPQTNGGATTSHFQVGSSTYIEVSGTPLWDTEDSYGRKFGSGSIVGLGSISALQSDGDLTINVTSDKGVAVRVDDARYYAGKIDLNGQTIIHTNNGYALMSESIVAGDYTNRYYGIENPYTESSQININKNGSSLVQIVGDLDHRTLRGSQYKLNLDRADSFLLGSSMKSNEKEIDYNGTIIKPQGSTDITLANGATWYMTGKSDNNTTGNSIVNKLTFANSGYLNMTASDTSSTHTYEQLTVNELLGDNGKILMNTDLLASYNNNNVNGTSTPGEQVSDRIIINKYADKANTILNALSEGTHTVDVQDSSLLHKNPAEGYLLLVEDHTEGNATFVGGELKKGGIFKYKPIITGTNPDPADYQGAPADSNNWYLTGFEKLNDVQDEVVVNAGLAESRYIAYMNEQDTLIKRLGELRQHDKEKGLWVRVRGANNSVEGYGLSRNSYVSTHLGYDWKLKEKETSKAKRYMGIAFNHTNNNFDYAASANGKGQSNVLTVYGTRLGDKGHYLDLVGKIGRMSNDYKYQGQQVEAKNWFYSLSAEYGRSIVRDKGWYYEPQVQFTYGHINGASYSSKETNINADNINSAILRAGLLVGRKFNEDKPEKNGSYYAKLFYNHEFGGDVKASMTDVYGDRFDFKHSYSGSWMTVGLGTSLNLNKKTNLYLDVEKAFGGKVSGGWAWQGGVRWRF